MKLKEKNQKIYQKSFFQVKKNCMFYHLDFLKKSPENNFWLFLLLIIIPENPVNSQLIILEKHSNFILGLFKNKSQKFTSIRAILILESKFPKINSLMIFEKLAFYNIINMKLIRL